MRNNRMKLPARDIYTLLSNFVLKNLRGARVTSFTQSIQPFSITEVKR